MAPLCRWHDLAVVAMWDGGADLAPSAGGSCERPKQTLFGMAFPPIRALPSIKPVCIDEMQAAAGSTFFILKGRIAALSDIHGNLSALNAVLAEFLQPLIAFRSGCLPGKCFGP